MSDKYKTAIVGNKDTILGFKALGLDTHDALDVKQATAILYKLKAKEIIINWFL